MVSHNNYFTQLYKNKFGDTVTAEPYLCDCGGNKSCCCVPFCGRARNDFMTDFCDGWNVLNIFSNLLSIGGAATNLHIQMQVYSFFFLFSKTI